jgi:hypothetical protein
MSSLSGQCKRRPKHRSFGCVGHRFSPAGGKALRSSSSRNSTEDKHDSFQSTSMCDSSARLQLNVRVCSSIGQRKCGSIAKFNPVRLRHKHDRSPSNRDGNYIVQVQRAQDSVEPKRTAGTSRPSRACRTDRGARAGWTSGINWTARTGRSRGGLLGMGGRLEHDPYPISGRSNCAR